MAKATTVILTVELAYRMAGGYDRRPEHECVGMMEDYHDGWYRIVGRREVIRDISELSDGDEIFEMHGNIQPVQD